MSFPGPLLVALILSMIWERLDIGREVLPADSKGLGWGQTESPAGPQQLLLPANLVGVCESRNPGSGFIFTLLGTFLGKLGLSLLLCPLHSLIHSIGKHVLSIACIPGSVLVIRNTNE